MIAALRTTQRHVWREWREHRSTLGTTSALLAVGFLVYGLVIAPSSHFRDPGVLFFLSALWFVVFYATVGGEVLGREARAGELGFLERLPSGLGSAFGGKLVFFAGATFACGVVGVGTVVALALLRTGSQPLLDDARMGWIPWALLLLPGLWCFAVSPWMPRGPLALPAGLAVLGVVWLPLVGTELFLPPWNSRGALLALGHGWLFVAAIAGAWAAFVRGLRFGGARTHAAREGLVMSALAMLPVAVISGAGWLRALSIDPHADDFHIERVHTTQDGRFALLQVHQGFVRVLVVDLSTGEWRMVGPLGADFLELRDPRSGEDHYFTVTWGKEPTFEPVFEGNGPAPEDLLRVQERGHGYAITDEQGEPVSYHDPFRQRDYAPGEITLPDRWFLVTPYGWLHRADPSAPDPEWRLLDPDTGAAESLPWRGRLPMLLDERYVFLHGGTTAWIGDLRERKFRSVETNEGLSFASTFHRRVLDEGTPCLFRSRTRLYLVDPEKAEARALPEEWLTPFAERYAVLPGDSDHVLAVLDDRLVRLDLRTGDREVVFPRDPVTAVVTER